MDQKTTSENHNRFCLNSFLHVKYVLLLIYLKAELSFVVQQIFLFTTAHSSTSEGQSEGVLMVLGYSVLIGSRLPDNIAHHLPMDSKYTSCLSNTYGCGTMEQDLSHMYRTVLSYIWLFIFKTSDTCFFDMLSEQCDVTFKGAICSLYTHFWSNKSMICPHWFLKNIT